MDRWEVVLALVSAGILSFLVIDRVNIEQDERKLEKRSTVFVQEKCRPQGKPVFVGNIPQAILNPYKAKPAGPPPSPFTNLLQAPSLTLRPPEPQAERRVTPPRPSNGGPSDGREREEREGQHNESPESEHDQPRDRTDREHDSSDDHRDGENHERQFNDEGDGSE